MIVRVTPAWPDLTREVDRVPWLGCDGRWSTEELGEEAQLCVLVSVNKNGYEALQQTAT